MEEILRLRLGEIIDQFLGKQPQLEEKYKTVFETEENIAKKPEPKNSARDKPDPLYPITNKEDVVTIIHTLDILTQSQRKQLTKKINDHFITKNVKYLNTVVYFCAYRGSINAAVLCEHLMV